MSKQAFGKFKRIFKTYVLPLSASVGIIYGVAQLVGTPSQNYRKLEITKSDHSEMDYFDKEVYRMIQEISVEGKSGIKYWHQFAQDRQDAEKLKRKRIQELIKEGRGSQEEVIAELGKIDNTMIQDSLVMLSKPEDEDKPEDEKKKKSHDEEKS
ncbi:uncharacterized protein LOC134823532 [Bolinopsis microptera]|uniref:uncharacterized protein LOC134823532 n=1 Tax=Bolinopsis microptera TaxID=2820187 RepID=UPI003079BBA8